jgi:GNAT superfamily N-acetyltransferase
MAIRIRADGDLPACVAVLRAVHERNGYPGRWPADPAGWLTPDNQVGAWVAEQDGQIAGHVGLVRGMPQLLLDGYFSEDLGGIVRLYVDPAARRGGLARALLDVATGCARDRGLQPVLDVVDDAAGAIALYERAGWRFTGTQPAWWTNPDGSRPTIRYYLGPVIPSAR